MNTQYINIVDGFDLFLCNAVQCATLIFGIDENKIHPAILKKVRDWQTKQVDNPYWNNPTHC
jgi:hypothetical protein